MHQEGFPSAPPGKDTHTPEHGPQKICELASFPRDSNSEGQVGPRLTGNSSPPSGSALFRAAAKIPPLPPPP